MGFRTSKALVITWYHPILRYPSRSRASACCLQTPADPCRRGCRGACSLSCRPIQRVMGTPLGLHGPPRSVWHTARSLRAYPGDPHTSKVGPGQCWTLVGPKIDFGPIARNGLRNGFPYLQGMGNHVVSSDPSFPKPFSSQRLLSPDPHGSLQEGVQRDL